MTWAQPFLGGTGWYTGTAVQGNSDVPRLLPVSIGAHEYLVEGKSIKRATVPITRPGVDQAAEPGEVSLSTQGLWRRSQSDWRLGSNQLMFDEADSKRNRFWSSKGLNPHPDKPSDAFQLRLHKDTESIKTASGSNLKLLPAGVYLYMVDGADLYFTSTLAGGSTSWTDTGMSTATAAADILSVCFDGKYVYAAVGSGGIFRTQLGTTTCTSFLSNAHPVSVVGYANGNLFAANGPDLNQVDSSGNFNGEGTPAATLLAYTHPNPAFSWLDFLGTPHGVFLTGNSGIAGELYRLDVDATTGALTAPISMFILPAGEALNDMQYYSGALIIATSAGVRIATVSIVYVINVMYGPVILIDGGVNAIWGQGQWAWFTWSDFDADSTGLGRLDLARFAADETPAMSSDLMSPSGQITQGSVVDVAVFDGTVCFAVASVGVFSEHPTDYVPSGWFNSGRILYGTTEKKFGVAADFYHDPLPSGSSIELQVVDERGNTGSPSASNSVGSVHPPSLLSLNSNSTSEQLSLVITLVNGTDLTDPPLLRRWTLYSLVTPRRVDLIEVPIILRNVVKAPSADGQDVYQDTLAEWQYLKGLEASGLPIIYVEGDNAQQVYISQIEVDGDRWSPDDHHWLEGTCTVRMITLDSGAFG